MGIQTSTPPFSPADVPILGVPLNRDTPTGVEQNQDDGIPNYLLQLIKSLGIYAIMVIFIIVGILVIAKGLD
jgi:hypothetical protein